MPLKFAYKFCNLHTRSFGGDLSLQVEGQMKIFDAKIAYFVTHISHRVKYHRQTAYAVDKCTLYWL